MVSRLTSALCLLVTDSEQAAKTESGPEIVRNQDREVGLRLRGSEPSPFSSDTRVFKQK